MKSRNPVAGVIGFLSVGLGVAAFAHGGATGVVAERMNGMMMLQEQVKLLNPMFNGSAEMDPLVVSNASKMIVDHAGEPMLAVFPEGSIEGPSEARQAIWNQWDEFRRQALRLSALGDELSVSIAAPAAPAPVPNPTEPNEPALPPLAEWEQMDLDVLLGLKSRDELAAEKLRAESEITGVDVDEPVVREARAVFADIVSTCSSCHSQFRN